MTKKILGQFVIILILCLGIYALNASASEVEGDLNPGLNTGITGVTKAAPTVSPAAGACYSKRNFNRFGRYSNLLYGRWHDTGLRYFGYLYDWQCLFFSDFSHFQ